MKFNYEKSIQILERTPATLTGLLQGIDEDWIKHNEGDGTWSPFDIVGHMLHGERKDWISRLTLILSREENQPFEPFDREAMFEESVEKTMDQLLSEFAVMRMSNLAFLKSYEFMPEDFKKTGIHPKLGTVNLSQLISMWTVHDLVHLSQISRVMAKQYRDAIGPWVQYIKMMN